MPAPTLDTAAVLGVFALELRAGQAPAHAALAQAQAGALAALIGGDLTAIAPQAQRLDLVLGAAHFDPAEVLRAGWPLHRRLRELWQRAPKQEGTARVIAFGSDAQGRVPTPLQADADLHGGALRVMPFALLGDTGTVPTVQDIFEAQLLDRGMASAQTALAVQDALAAPIEHARYLTLMDLLAMTALQYQNQGLEPLWPLIETALLRPQQTMTWDTPPEPCLEYRNGTATLHLPSPHQWQLRYAPNQSDSSRLARGYTLHEMRLRQFAAVLRAHRIDYVYASVPDSPG